MTIQESGYPVEPWCLRETSFNLELLAQSESVMALSNGHIGCGAADGVDQHLGRTDLDGDPFDEPHVEILIFDVEQGPLGGAARGPFGRGCRR